MKIILYISLFLFVSCNSTNNVNSSNVLFNNTDNVKKGIVYLFFEVEKQENSNIVVKLVDKKITEGFVKSENIDMAKPNNSFYKIQLLDSRLQPVKTFFIDDPLNPILESYSLEGMAKEKG